MKVTPKMIGRLDEQIRVALESTERLIDHADSTYRSDRSLSDRDPNKLARLEERLNVLGEVASFLTTARNSLSGYE